MPELLQAGMELESTKNQDRVSMDNTLISRKVFQYLCVLCLLGLQGLHLQAEVKKSVFGAMPDGTNIYIYTLEEGSLKARIVTYGARLVSLETPDRDGKVADV